MLGFWIFYPFFFAFIILGILFIAINSKKIRRKYKFDTLPIYLVIYIINVCFVLGLLKGGVVMLILTTALMVLPIMKVANVQVIGITGIVVKLC
jgi:hypothetical protein